MFGVRHINNALISSQRNYAPDKHLFHQRQRSPVKWCWPTATSKCLNTPVFAFPSAHPCTFWAASTLTLQRSQSNMDALNWLKTGKKVSWKSPGGVHSNGEHWALQSTWTCEHLSGHVPLFALINASLDKQTRGCAREFQPGRRDEPGCQYPQCWGLHLVLSVQLQAECWGEAWAWGKRLWNCRRAQGLVMPARCLDTLGHGRSWGFQTWLCLDCACEGVRALRFLHLGSLLEGTLLNLLFCCSIVIKLF